MSDMDVTEYGLFSLATGEFVASVSGTVETLIAQYKNPETEVIKGVFDKNWTLVDGKPKRVGEPFDVLKARLQQRVRQDHDVRRAKRLQTAAGLTRMDLAYMALAPIEGDVDWTFEDGRKTLTQEAWRAFVAEVWTHVSALADQENQRRERINKARTRPEIQDLVDELLPELK